MLQKKKQIHRHKVGSIRKVVAAEHSTSRNSPAVTPAGVSGNVQEPIVRRPSAVQNFFKSALERVKTGKHIRFFVDDIFKTKETKNDSSVPPRPIKEEPSSFKEFYPHSMPANILSLLLQRYTATIAPARTELPRWITWPRWLCSAKLAGRIIGPLGSG